MTIAPGEAREDLLKTRLMQAGIPKYLRSKTLKGFYAHTKSLQEILKAANEYVEYFCAHKGEQVDGVALRGPVGCGKTHIAIAILREVIARGFSGLYCNVPEFLKDIRATYDANTGPDESSLIEYTREVDLLILDDLGVENRILDPVRDRGKWLCDRMYLVINGRLEADRPIIMTTNCSLDELEQQFDKRIVSRLYEMTRRKFPPFPDTDYRKAHMK